MNKEKTVGKEKKPVRKGTYVFITYIALFCALILFVALYGLLTPDKQFSENENRILAQKPVFTVQGLFDGSYTKDIENYLSDQFAFRDEAIYLKSVLERAWGKKAENGAYIGKNGFLFDSQSAFDETKMASVAKQIRKFARKNSSVNMTFALVPNSSYIYAENLPTSLELESQKTQVASFYKMLKKDVNVIDTFTPLMNAKEDYQVFYKTDHHWTTRGAFAVFSKIAKALKISYKEKNYEFHTVSNSFEGTLKSKSIAQNVKDTVEVCYPKKSAGKYVLSISGVKDKRASCFFEEKLNEKNHYEVFFGGNYGRMTITTMAEDKVLLVIKDSFANCLIPMLTPYYSKIVVLDPRYMTEGISGIMKEFDFTDVLFLYNANTFFEDTSLVSVLEN